ncbi:hypothetical protein [Brevibacillus brevis]|uniref:hypothetical protein n=1 Tax=Brevibacillus brevis TaxID=1393 RepID=UPI0037CB8954
MPRIERIRIVGLKYDQMAKQYKDIIFDLSHDGEPGHALMASPNGGGKGVLLQSIFQLLMPETKWGKKNNSVLAFFHDKKHRFLPYTFHVVIEWRLDQSQYPSYLLTGIAMSANKGKEQEATLDYTLYTLEHTLPSEFTLMTLPLYDKDTKTVASLQEIKDFIKRYKNEFRVFSRSYDDKKKYFSYLAQHDIHESEWINLKTINKSEGGINNYLEKYNALTNKGLFEQLIFPVISGSFSNEADPLDELFKNTALIAQRLPQLEKRATLYRELIRYFQPVHESLTRAIQTQKSFQQVDDEGKWIYSAFSSFLEDKEKEKCDWDRQLGEVRHRKSELAFEQANLLYNQEKRSVEAIAQTLETLQNDILDLQSKHEEIMAKQKKNELHVLLAERKQIYSEWKTVDNLIQTIRSQLNLEEEEQHLIEIQNALRDIWPQIQLVYSRRDVYFRLKKNSILELKGQIQSRMTSLSKRMGVIEKLLDDIAVWVKKYTDELGQLRQRYGSLIEKNPSVVLNDKERDHKIHVRKAEDLHDVIETINDELSNCKIKLASLNSKKEVQDRAQRLVEKQLDDRIKQEQEVWKQLVPLFQAFDEADNYLAVYHTEKWESAFQKIFERIEERLHRIRQDLFRKNLDVELSRQSFWIPNQDLIRLKEYLEQKGIKEIYYGTEFLSALPVEHFKEEWKRHPLLPFGLILSQGEEKKLQGLRLEEVAQSPVPIFIRENMDRDSSYEVFRVLSNDTLPITASLFEEWKKTIEQTLLELETKESEAKTHQKNLRAKYQQWLVLLQGTSSETIEQELEECTRLLNNTKQEMSRVENLEKQKREELVQKERELQDTNDETETLHKQVTEVSLWIEKTKEHERMLSLQQVLKAEEKENVHEQEQLGGEQRQLTQLEETLMGEKHNWESKKSQTLQDARICLGDLCIIDAIEDTLEDAILTVQSCEEQFEQGLFKWKEMQKSIHEKSKDLAVMEDRFTRLTQGLQEQEDVLAELDTKWREEPEPTAAKELLRDEGKALDEQEQHLQRRINGEKEQFYKLKGRFEEAGERLLKEAKKVLDDCGKPVQNREGNLDEAFAQLQLETTELVQSEGEILEILATVTKQMADVTECSNKMSGYLPSSFPLLLVDAIAYKEITSNPKKCFQNWKIKRENIENEKRDSLEQVKRNRVGLKIQLEALQHQDGMVSKLLRTFEGLPWEWDSLSTGLRTVDNFLLYANQEVTKVEGETKGLEKTRETWVDRASSRVISMLDTLKRMEKRMAVTNQNNFLFPLIRIQYKHIFMPKTTEDVKPYLRIYFTECVENLLKEFTDMEKVPSKKIKDLINDGRLVYIALQKRFPMLQVYKPTTENEFMYQEPQDYHYTDWEVINQGSATGVEAGGSGGQTQSVQIIVAMMILTHKRVMRENKGWTIFIYDNPFGEMVSENVLDPIFAISEALQFQWIIVTPPELVKLDVSRRFPVYIQFSAEKGTVTQTIHQGRRSLHPTSLFD